MVNTKRSSNDWEAPSTGANGTTPTLEQIEADIDQLSVAKQLWLMERLAHRIRTRTLRMPTVQDSELAEMAHDPAIQHELQQINIEFGVTEADGLDRAP